MKTMLMTGLAALTLATASLTACNDKPAAPTNPPAEQPPKPVAVATPWDGMKAAEQRARDVQGVVDKQAEQQRKQIEAAQP